jgi:hypothetical protein
MAGGVVAAYYIGKTLQITISQRDESLRAERINKAFSFIQRWNAAPLEEKKQWWSVLSALLKKTAPEIEQMLETMGCQERTVVVGVLNFFEEVCLAINEGSADEDTLRKFFRGTVETYYSLLGEWIKKQRTDRVRPRPRAYVQFEQVAEKWQQGR